MRAIFLRLSPLCLLASAVALGATTRQNAAGLPTDGSSQKASPTTAAVNNFSQEPYVILRRDSVIAMKEDGTGYRETALSIRIQSESALKEFGVLSLPFASGSSHLELHFVRVRHADGSVVETPISQAIEQPAPVTRDAPFYSDLKDLQLPIRSLKIGDTLEWEARDVITRAEATGQFWGQETFFTAGIALEESLELRVPVNIHVTAWTNPKGIDPPSDATKGDLRTVRWVHSNTTPTVGTVADAARKAEEKRMLTAEDELDVQKGALPSVAWTTFADWTAVGAWYHDLSADRVVPDATIKAKVLEITANSKSEEEKARAVYNYVSTQVRYIGVAFGIGRYQPHLAADVLANQYGDCKDKHTLLAAMLTELGLHPEAVLIGDGVRFNPAVPSPASFNHLITRVRLGNEDIWLDSTAEVAPWRVLLPAIRDQEALIVPTVGAANVQRTPARLPFPAFAKLEATGTLDTSLTATYRITMTFRDDDEIGLRSVLRQVSPGQYGEFVQRLMQNMGFGGKTSEAEITNVEDLAQPLTLAFSYNRVKEADWGTNRITEPFMMIALPTVDDKNPPTATIQLGTPRTESSHIEISPPAGWGVELPEAAHAHSTFATSDTTFRFANGKIYADRKLVVLTESVPASEWKHYKEWADNASIGSYPYIQLVPATKDSHASAPAKSGKSSKEADEPAPSDTSAEKLVQDATESLQRMDADGARNLLDQAKAINPKQRGLWFGYAGIAYLLGKSNEAIANMREELKLHSDEIQLYQAIAAQEQAHGDNAAALADLRTWSSLAPDDPAAANALVAIFISMKQNEEAAKSGSAMLERLSKTDGDLTPLRLSLGQAQLNLGRKQEAVATISPVLQTATNPLILNNAAYMLAESGLDLAAAETTEHDVLEKLEAETADWTLDESPATLRQKTSLLTAVWDTMGWILFREGKLTEAKSFVEAAWMNTTKSDALSHIREINAGLHATDSPEMSKDSQQLRTYPLGPSKGRVGTVEFQLLLAGGKVLRAEAPHKTEIPGVTPPPPTEKKPVLTGAADLAKTADLHKLFPPGSSARLVRDGFVTCSGDFCELVLAPL